MKKIYAITLAVLGTFAFSSTSNAQTLVKNDGATITIEAGAVLFIEGGLENTNSGTIDNQGTIELEGDFLNSSTYSGTADTVRFSGADHSDMTSNGATIGVLELDKDATKNVNLLDDATVMTELNFVGDDNKLAVDTSNLVMLNNAVLTSYDENEYVLTAGAGFLVIEDIAMGDTETFPVGPTAAKYNPLTVTGAAGHATDDYSVRALDSIRLMGTTGDAIEEGVVNTSWEMQKAGATNTNLNVTAQWAGSDELLNFEPSESGISRYDGADWDLKFDDLDAAAGADPYTRQRLGLDDVGVLGVGSDGSPALASKVLVNVKVFLQGPYNAGVMSDTLRGASLLPIMEPYTALAENPLVEYRGFPTDDMAGGSAFVNNGDNTNIVDWVVVEIRDLTDSVIASVPAMIQKDGFVVGLEGSGNVEIPGVEDGFYYIAVKHRNHLAVRTNDSLSLSSTVTNYDFTDAMSKAYNNPVAAAFNPPMFDLGGGVFGMYTGDAGNNNVVSLSGGSNDKTVILGVLGAGNAGGVVFPVYSQTDVNLNTRVNLSGGTSDKTPILTALGAGNAGGTVQGHVNN